VYVTGKVRAPACTASGRIRWPFGSHPQAGGTPEDASIKNVRVIHANGQEEVAIFPRSGTRSVDEAPSVGSGDMVIVPDLISRFQSWLCEQTGFYPMLDGHTYQLSDAVSYAGGASRRAACPSGDYRTVNGSSNSESTTSVVLAQGRLDPKSNDRRRGHDYVPETNAITLAQLSGNRCSCSRLLLHEIKRPELKHEYSQAK